MERFQAMGIARIYSILLHSVVALFQSNFIDNTQWFTVYCDEDENQVLL